MSETTTPAKPSWTDPSFVIKTAAAVGLAAAVLALELTNHADKGTFIQMVAGPGLAYLIAHVSAKSLH